METWDFVIVGAGAAGRALAAGLAAGGKKRILVLESGHGAAHPSRRGIRPHILEFDHWSAVGCSGWAPEDVLPHFKCVEADAEFGQLPPHGSKGPIKVSRTPEADWSNVDWGFRSAALEEGHPWAPNHNAPGVLGVSPLARGKEDSGPWARTLFGDEQRHGGISLRGGVLVDRILWDGNRAAGVIARHGGHSQSFFAGEVLLCAGAVGSPAVLQRSGIGPPEVLRRAGVVPLIDSPVGIGLQTHPRVVVASGSAENSGSRSLGMLARWNTGLEATGSGDMMAWTVNRQQSISDRDWRLGAPPGFRALVVGALAQVFSRGRTAIESADPEVKPVLEPALLSHPLDRIRSRLMYRHLSNLISRPEFRDALGAVTDESGRPWRFGMTDIEVDGWAETAFQPAGHHSSSCRMGDPSDPAAVVDPQCRVYGVKGVRVVDASIFPTMVRADPWLTEAVVGSRAAQLIAASEEKVSNPLVFTPTTEILR